MDFLEYQFCYFLLAIKIFVLFSIFIFSSYLIFYWLCACVYTVVIVVCWWWHKNMDFCPMRRRHLNMLEWDFSFRFFRSLSFAFQFGKLARRLTFIQSCRLTCSFCCGFSFFLFAGELFRSCSAKRFSDLGYTCSFLA